MIQTFQQMQHKISGAEQLESVVRTMKAQAAANITQYETAVKSLDDYVRTIELGLTACMRQSNSLATGTQKEPNYLMVIVFGSDQGLVGQFNDQLTDYVKLQIKPFTYEKKIIAVGTRISDHLSEAGFPPDKTFNVPGMIGMVTEVISDIIIECINSTFEIENTRLLIFYNCSTSGIVYKPTQRQLLPLNAKWQVSLAKTAWPTANLPEMINEDAKPTLRLLIREHLFISLFRACVESLASENASRLMAMQRAEKNIDTLLDDLKQTSRILRQSTIDEELFDVISSYESSK